MKPKNNISMFETLKALSSEQRAAATMRIQKLQNSNNESKKHKNGLIKTVVIFTCIQTIVFTTAITTQTEISQRLIFT